MKPFRFLLLCILLGWGMSACSASQSKISTKSYILTTGFEEGNLVYLGVGGEINGKANPTLYARPGETVTLILINGGEGTHDIYIPGVNAKSQRVHEQGERTIITFTVPDKEIDLEYYDSTANHAVIGMNGTIRISSNIFQLMGNEGQSGAQSTNGDMNSNAGAQLFAQKCASCHTIGGGTLVGPDLQGVADIREMGWLKDFISKPDEMLASGDPIATALLEEYNNIAMPNLALSDQEVEDILAYLVPQDEEASATLEEETQDLSQQSGSFDGDPDYGEFLFTGKVALRNGGTPCIACHSVEGVGVIGGGTLGPDLTQSYERFGEIGLAASLSGMPFPTMQGIFENKELTESEVNNLLAFFEKVGQNGLPSTQRNTTFLFGAGSVLTIILLGVMLIFWPRQRMSLSQRLRKQGKLK